MSRAKKVWATRVGAAMMLMSTVAMVHAVPGETLLSSVTLPGIGFNGFPTESSISKSGRFIAFESDATNLVQGDSNGASDIFVRDMVMGTTTRISVGPGNVQSNGPSGKPAISADGRFVAYESSASNLIFGDTNNNYDVFVRDLLTGSTFRASVNSTEGQGNGYSGAPAISADGRFIAFDSNADNLVIGDTNAATDIFVRDIVAGTTIRVNVDSAEQQAGKEAFLPAISADGKFVAFESLASNLVPNDTNGSSDAFVRDLEAGVTFRVSVNSSEVQGNGTSGSVTISENGLFVAFESYADNLVAGDTNSDGDIFVRDVLSGTTTRVSVSSTGVQGNSGSRTPVISDDGRFVIFPSVANNLASGDTNGAGDIFMRDRVVGVTRRVSVSSSGAQGNGGSDFLSMSGDGRFVTFTSGASNLVTGDTNNAPDLFRHETPLPNTVSGKVTVPGLVRSLDLVPVHFLLAPTGGGVVTRIHDVQLKLDGTYSFSTAATGTFNIYASMGGSLQQVFKDTITLSSGSVSGVNFALVLGDCDGNNYVGTDDYLILNGAFDTSLGDAVFDPRADLNGDNYVGTDDYLILNGNFDLSGD